MRGTCTTPLNDIAQTESRQTVDFHRLGLGTITSVLCFGIIFDEVVPEKGRDMLRPVFDNVIWQRRHKHQMRRLSGDRRQNIPADEPTTLLCAK